MTGSEPAGSSSHSSSLYTWKQHSKKPNTQTSKMGCASSCLPPSTAYIYISVSFKVNVLFPLGQWDQSRDLPLYSSSGQPSCPSSVSPFIPVKSYVLGAEAGKVTVLTQTLQNAAVSQYVVLLPRVAFPGIFTHIQCCGQRRNNLGLSQKIFRP